MCVSVWTRTLIEETYRVCASECDRGTSQRWPTECVRLSVIEEPHREDLQSVCVWVWSRNLTEETYRVCASECDRGTSQRRSTECVRLSVMEEPHRGDPPSVCIWVWSRNLTEETHRVCASECDQGTSQRRPRSTRAVVLNFQEYPMKEIVRRFTEWFILLQWRQGCSLLSLSSKHVTYVQL